jgi:hypothetical protein
MKVFFRVVLVFLLFLALISTSCDSFSKDAGTFAVKFSWAKDGEGNSVKPDISTGDFFVTVRIYEWKEGVSFPGDIAANGKQLTQSDAAQMKTTGTSIDFGDLSYGSRRFVVAEIRKGEELTNSVLFTGMSKLFELKAGKHTEVNVEMKLTPTPGVDEEGNRIDAELRIVDDNGNLRSYTSGNDLKVKLRLLNAISFTHIYFANKEENLKAENGKIFKIEDLEDVDEVDNGYELGEDWDLSFGLTDEEIEVLPELKVYARIENEYGQGLLLMAKIALDNTPPELVVEIDPENVNGTKPVKLAVSANELIKHDTLNIQTTNPKLAFDCPAPKNNESLSFLCTIENIDESLDDGEYEVIVQVTDQAGNLSEKTASFILDRTPPDITVNSCAITTRRAITKNGIAAATYDDVVEVTLGMEVEEGIVPVVTLGNKELAKDCSTPSQNCFTYTVSEKDSEGFKFVGIDAVDAAGNEYNETVDLDNCSAVFDFTGPTITNVMISRIPDFSPARDHQNKILNLSLKDPFSNEPVILQINLFADEDLIDDEIDVSGFEFSEPIEIIGNYVRFEKVLDLSVSQGDHNLEIHWQDVLGNYSVRDIEWKLFVDSEHVDILTIDMEKVLYTRKPWGTDDTGGVPKFSVSGEAGSISNTGISTIIANNELGTIIGSTTVDKDGKFNISNLNGGDIPKIYLNPVKKSGVKAEGKGGLVTNVLWVATMGYKTAGSDVENPNKYKTLTKMSEKLIENELETKDMNQSDVIKLQKIDTNIYSVQSIGSWKQNKSVSKTISARNYHAMAYDSARGETILFGGQQTDGICDESGSNLCGGTYKRDGFNWIKINPENSPVPRMGHKMVYDASREKIVLFGGYYFAGKDIFFDETWEWDGFNWKKLDPETKPYSRYNHEMVYDSERGRVVMFGGVMPWYYGGTNNETWEWDGTDWRQIAGDSCLGGECYICEESDCPSPRYDFGMVYDSNRKKTILYGGTFSLESDPFDDAWEWDGKIWSKIEGSFDDIIPLTGLSMTYDRHKDRILFFGGVTTDNTLSEKTWEWDGTEITSFEHDSIEFNRRNFAMIFDEINKTTMVFGGFSDVVLSDTIIWNGEKWIKVDSTAIPDSRQGTDVSYDLFNNEIVMFGGDSESDCDGSGSRYCNTTWLWSSESQTWKKADGVSTIPDPRNNHAMSYDRKRERTVMFGGQNQGWCDNSLVYGELCGGTWEWDGSQWTMIEHLAVKPTPRQYHKMVYDTANEVTILFGGSDDSDNCDDSGGWYCNKIWEWNGVSWNAKEISGQKPAGRFGHAMAYDEVRNKLVVFGGWVEVSEGIDHSNETWEWDGESWTEISPANKPSPRVYPAMTYDAVRKKIIMLGGTGPNCDDSGNYGCYKTWEWDGVNWTEIELEKDLSFFDEESLVFDPVSEKTILFGGYGKDSGSWNKFWELNHESGFKPAQIMEVPFLYSNADSSSEIISINPIFYAGGSGYPDGVESKGVEMFIWDEGMWKKIGQNDAGFDDIAIVSWNTAYDSYWSGLSAEIFKERIWRIFTGRTKSLYFAVSPSIQSGESSGKISVDYAEVVVRYKIMKQE